MNTRQANNLQLMRYRTDHGVYTAIVKTGRKLLSVVMLDSAPITVRKAPIDDVRFMREVADYPLRKAARQMLLAGSKKRLGMTKTARALLKEATL